MAVTATTVKKPSENSPLKRANRRRCERKQTPQNRVKVTKGRSWEKTMEDASLTPKQAATSCSTTCEANSNVSGDRLGMITILDSIRLAANNSSLFLSKVRRWVFFGILCRLAIQYTIRERPPEIGTECSSTTHAVIHRNKAADCVRHSSEMESRRSPGLQCSQEGPLSSVSRPNDGKHKAGKDNAPADIRKGKCSDARPPKSPSLPKLGGNEFDLGSWFPLY